MLNLNRAMVIGNATRDPEIRTTPNGKSVASFAVATNRRFTDASGEQRDETEFHEIVAWGKLAEIADKIISKGNKLYVEGRLQTRRWEGQDGNRREKTEIVADNIINLSPRGSSYGSGSSSSAPSKKSEKPSKSQDSGDIEDDINLDEIPF